MHAVSWRECLTEAGNQAMLVLFAGERRLCQGIGQTPEHACAIRAAAEGCQAFVCPLVCAAETAGDFIDTNEVAVEPAGYSAKQPSSQQGTLRSARFHLGDRPPRS